MVNLVISLVLLYTAVFVKATRPNDLHSRIPLSVDVLDVKGDNVDMKFTMEIKDDIVLSKVNPKDSGKFWLFVQPPSMLNLVKVNSKMTLVKGIEDKVPISGVTDYGTSPAVQSPDTCNPSYVINGVLKALNEKYQYAAGIFINDTASMRTLEAVINVKDTGVTNVLGNESEKSVKAGVYTWEATYKKRANRTTELGINDVFDDWIVSLVVDGNNGDPLGYGSYCAGYDGLSSKVFFNHSIQRKYSIVFCNGYSHSMLMEDNVEKFYSRLDATVDLSVSRGVSDWTSLRISFKVGDKNEDHVTGDDYELRIKLPEKDNLGGKFIKHIDQDELCKEGRTQNIHKYKCNLYEDTNELVYTFKKSDVVAKKDII